VEAAGIEPGRRRCAGRVSRRHRAEARHLPRKTAGWRALSRAPNRHLAGSVDQRDHGGPALRSAISHLCGRDAATRSAVGTTVRPNLRPSGYEQPQGTSQPVPATDKPSQSLPDGQEDLADSLQPVTTLPNDFGPPVVRTPMPDLGRTGSLLTVKQVAAWLGVSAATVYGLCERRELHHVRVANAIRVSPDALEAFLRSIATAAPKRRPRASSGFSDKAPA
jgi:excisionase family DNA binding protein